jgi:hypothetical protein
MEQSLQGRDLVLSCEEPGAWGQLHNAAMASTAGHPFWLAVLQEAMRRCPAAVAANSGWVQLHIWKLWHRTPFFNGLLDVLRTTGPILLTDVYRVRAAAVRVQVVRMQQKRVRMGACPATFATEDVRMAARSAPCAPQRSQCTGLPSL